jgi:hypothetical protein
MLATLRRSSDRRTQVFWPKIRVKKMRTDDLTRARMGLYRIWTA